MCQHKENTQENFLDFQYGLYNSSMSTLRANIVGITLSHLVYQ